MNDLEDKNNQNVLASPKARKFARELGVDVRDVVGSERLGRVIEEDIKEFVSSKFNKNENTKINKEYEHSEFGKVEIKKIPRIKRIAAPHLVNSWKNIPHVTNHDEVDITELDKRLSSQKGIKVEFQTITEANHFFSKTDDALTKTLDKYIKKETALY